MARHLIKHGYRRIAYVGSRMDRDYRTIQRYEGHREVLASAGIDGSRLLKNDEAASYRTGGRLFMEAMARYPDLDAIHFTNDNLAGGAILEANRHGIRVPDDIAIAGYLGLPLSECLTPALTTVAVPRFEMGVQAARFLLARLDGEQGEALRCDIGFELMVGDST